MEKDSWFKWFVITSTAALIEIVIGLIPQFKLNKAKLLCAEYYSLKDTMKGLSAGENIQKKITGYEEGNIIDYCRSF